MLTKKVTMWDANDCNKNNFDDDGDDGHDQPVSLSVWKRKRKKKLTNHCVGQPTDDLPLGVLTGHFVQDANEFILCPLLALSV